MTDPGRRPEALAKGLRRNVFIGALGLGALAVALVVVLMSVQSYNERKARIDHEKDSLSRMAEIVAVETSEMLDKLKFFFKAADLWLSAHPAADPRFDRDFARLVDEFRSASKGIFDIRLVSASGGLFYIPSTSTAPLAEVGDRSYFKAQLSPGTRGFFVGEPVFSRVTGRWGIPISYPLSSANGGITVIFAALELRTIDDLFERIRPKPGGSISLVRRDGRFLARIPFDESYMTKSIAEDPGFWWAGFSSADVLVMRSASTDQAERIIAARTIKDPDIAISVTAKIDDVLADWRAGAWIKLAITAGMIAAIGVFAARLIYAMRKVGAVQGELAESVARLREADSTKDKLISILAHDLRGPIGGICSLLDTMAQDLDGLERDDLSQYISALRVGSRNTYQLLENILSWFRAKRGDMPFQPAMIEVRPLAEECAAVYSLALASKGLSLGIESDPGLEAWADPDLLKTVIRNLISNAIKFSRSGGRISVAAGAVPGGVRLIVRDEGIGMDAETKEALFARGGPGSRSGTASEGGSGLGLMLCRDIVEMHGGRIEAESAEGSGTSIAFFLPDRPTGSAA